MIRQKFQGNCIKIQAHYECRRHDTPAKPRVQWGQSPKWNPGYTRTKSNIELRRSGTITRAFALRLGSAAPTGLKNMYQYLTQGLRPGLCKSIALTGLLYVFPITLLFWYACPAKVPYRIIISILEKAFVWVRKPNGVGKTKCSSSWIKWKLQLKSVQTSAVVCTDYTCSLHRLRRGFENRKRIGYFAFAVLDVFSIEPYDIIVVYW